MLFEDRQTVLHQLIVIRLVAGGLPQLRDSARLRECNPDLRYQYAFQIKTGNIHNTFLLFTNIQYMN